MKTKLALLVCCAILAGQQAWGQAQVALGVKAGPNFATIDTKASAGENYENRTGFHGGAFFLVKAGKIGIQPEVIFSQQGSKVEIDSKSFESNFSYINIPVMLKLYTIAGINIQAGPQFGFVTSAEAPIREQLEYRVEDVKDDMKSSDLTLGLGLGWDLPFGLTIDARYNLGLSKIYDDAPNPQQSTDAKNQVFQLSLGYKLIKFGK
jgi:hypothetical protein